MTAVKMTSGNRYTFTAIDGSPVLIGSTDHVGADATKPEWFRNTVYIDDANGGSSGQLMIRNSSNQVQYGPQIRLYQSGTGNTGIHFDQTGGTHSSDWSIGTDSSEGTEFRWNSSTALTSVPDMMLSTDGDLTLKGDLTTSGRMQIKKADNDVSDHLQFYNGTVRVGEIG